MKGEAESTTANAQRRRVFLWTVPGSLGQIKNLKARVLEWDVETGSCGGWK
jgi:hypothetical protein